MLAVAWASVSTAAEIRLEVGASRSPGAWDSQAEARVKDLNRRAAILSHAERARSGFRTVFTLPTRVILTQNGQPLPVIRARSRDGAGDIVPTFDASGSRAFPVDYQNYLVSVFNAAKPAMDAVFGTPFAGGPVNVRNYDADIQDRYAVAGGYFVPNAPGGPEIRFPVYQSPASAAINYIHCLLLAYLGSASYPFEFLNEGFVRAATMTIARTPGAIPGVTSDEIEQTLDSLYDSSTTYDWTNQAALASPTFIAPNLLNTPLPTGGSTGGIFLLRYKMAGTCWAKALAEYPGFVKVFNQNFYANPAAVQTIPDILALGQAIANSQAGGPNATIEGRNFSEWFERQHILDPRINGGLKLLIAPTPIIAQAASDDFGVFDIVLNAFRMDANGNETLIAGRGFPIYWRPDFTRFFVTAQDDVLDVAGAYGSVTPNFPAATFFAQPYRVAVDVPFQGKIARSYLPAGGFSTGAVPTPRDFFGTLVGVPLTSTDTYTITVEWVGGVQPGIPIQNFAFGATIADPNFQRAQPLTVRVFRSSGGAPTEIFSRRVNKGQGGIGLDLRTPDCDTTFALSRPARQTGIGLPIDPYRPNPADLLQQTDLETLIARYNSVAGRYDVYPIEGELRQGLGYFARPSVAGAVNVTGRTSAQTPIAVALQPGWNLVTAPNLSSIPATNLQVTTSTQAVVSYSTAAGDIVGATFFRFDPDPSNPDQGTLIPATSFNPGEAYFVRANRSEGAVLLFPAVAPSLPGRLSPDFAEIARKPGKGGTTSNGNPKPGKGGTPPTPPPPTTGKGGKGNSGGSTTTPPPARQTAWQNRIEFTSSVGQATHVLIGQTQNASRGFLGREDDELPLGPGGFQAAIAGVRTQFRDTRPLGYDDVFVVDLEGLVPGRQYTIRPVARLGRQTLSVNDGRSLGVVLRPGQTANFIASGSRQRLFFVVVR